METLAIILARGGSLGIPRKNIRILAGKPLIEYTINAAKKSKQVSRIIVSTDDTKIAKISLLLGVEVPFLRPKKLSKNSTTNLEVIKHTIKTLNFKESYTPDIITVLQPTSPLRSSMMIDKSIERLKKSHVTSVLGVTLVKPHPSILFSNKTKFLKPLDPNFEKHTIRQKRKAFFQPTGSIYTFWYKTLSEYDSIYGPKILPIIISDASLNLDIDTPYDFFIAEMTVKYWKKFKNKF